MDIANILGSSVQWLISADNAVRIAVLALIFFIVYVSLRWWPELGTMSALAISYIPIFLIDWFYSFGVYTFKLPLGISYTVQNTVLTLQGLSFLFNFEIFKMFGLPIFNSISGVVTLSGFQSLAVWILTFGDSILEFIILSYALYYIFNDVTYALIGASIPVSIYTIISNPLKEFNTATQTISHLLYFAQKSTAEQQIIVLGTLVLSFMAVWILLSISINLFFSGAKIIRPGLEEKQYSISFSGTAFGMTVIYSISQILHPLYSWYAVIPILIIAGILKNMLQRHANSKKESMGRMREIEEAIRGSGIQ